MAHVMSQVVKAPTHGILDSAMTHDINRSRDVGWEGHVSVSFMRVGEWSMWKRSEFVMWVEPGVCDPPSTPPTRDHV